MVRCAAREAFGDVVGGHHSSDVTGDGVVAHCDGPNTNMVVIAALLFIAILATISIPGALLSAVLITIVKAISSH